MLAKGWAENKLEKINKVGRWEQYCMKIKNNGKMKDICKVLAEASDIVFGHFCKIGYK